MATTVATVEEVTLQDGSTVTLRPLVLTGLRKFMKRFNHFTDAKTEEESMDRLIDTAALCLSKARPEFWNEDKDNGTSEVDGKEVPNPKGGSTEAFEDAIDMPTLYKIVEICGGIKLNDPNLIAAAMEMAGPGKTST